MKREVQLSPAQKNAFDCLQTSLPNGSVFVLRGGPGMGKTMILNKLQAAIGGSLVGVRSLFGDLAARHPFAIEEAFLDVIERQLAAHDLVLVDDFGLLAAVTESCTYPRDYMIDAALTAILAEAGARGKKLVFATWNEIRWPIRRRAQVCEIAEFTPEDYSLICEAHLGVDAVSGMDFAKIHRFAPSLNAHQLKNACQALAGDAALDTDAFIAYLKAQNMTSNVDLAEVQPVDWNDLKGVDDVIAALEAKIALPLENDALATELNLKPKRGVLLAGPPGTGKTTIGRALAHRLKGKFFLIDGTFISGTDRFYSGLREIFEQAKQNAPSVIFIDDTDVLFEGDEDKGFYRYLLTMLDGLESASAERVCVMMTAMNVGSLPPAMLRSGRVELWLETREPNLEAREAILAEKLAKIPEPLGLAGASELAAASQGLTGADLKAVIEDGKLLFAHDKARGVSPRRVEEYFLEAIATVRKNRRDYTRSRPAKLETVKVGFGAPALQS